MRVTASPALLNYRPTGNLDPAFVMASRHRRELFCDRTINRSVGRGCLGDPAPGPSMFEPSGAAVVSIDGPRIAALAQFLL